MREHWLRLIADAERRAGRFLATQITCPGAPARGAVPTSWGIADPKPTLFAAANAMACFLNPDSSLHGDARIPEAYSLALDFAEHAMNEDGTFDYPYCNFRSAPDTAFIANRVFVTRALIAEALGEEARGRQPGTGPSLGDSDPSAMKNLLGRIDELLIRAGRGIAAGGFHTPNHRWACAAALSSCHRLSGDGAFTKAAEAYLLEGIDANADGEYAERSSGNYNAVNNEQMIILAKTRDDPSFLDHVERNLSMMLCYIDPDGTVFTENSTRQDRGQQTWPDQYWFQYLLLAHERRRADFAAMARSIMEGIMADGREAPDCLDMVMLELGSVNYFQAEKAVDGTMRAATSAVPPTEYRRLFRDSGVARGRMGDFSYSLLRGKNHFLVIQSGGLRASLRLGVGFFERRDFVPDSLEQAGEDFVLRLGARGWYYLPFREKPPTSDWWAMDNSKRERIFGPDLDFELRLGELEAGDGVELSIRATGWDGIPLRLEIGLSAGAELESEHFCLETRPGEAILAKDGTLTLRKGLDVLEIKGAMAQHRNMDGTYGSESRSAGLFTVYFTALTPVDHVVTFRRADPRRRTP